MSEPGLMQVLTWGEWLMLAGVVGLLIVAVIVTIEFFKILWKM